MVRDNLWVLSEVSPSCWWFKKMHEILHVIIILTYSLYINWLTWLSLLFFISSLLPPRLSPPPPPPPPSPPPPPLGAAPVPPAASPWAPLTLWLAPSFGCSASLSSGLEAFLITVGTTPSCRRHSMMLSATSQIRELMSWVSTEYRARRIALQNNTAVNRKGNTTHIMNHMVRSFQALMGWTKC